CTFSARSTWADTSGGVTSRSPARMRTTSALGMISKGTWRASSRTSSQPRPMKRLTEYTVRPGFLASWRRAASPTTTPPGVYATMEGRSLRPSRSGMTRGTPAPSTYATRLLVVPRSMPTMRDMPSLVLANRLGEIIDHRTQIGTRGQSLLESLEQRLPLLARVAGGIPFGSPGDQRVLFGLVALLESLPLGTQPFRRLVGQPR